MALYSHYEVADLGGGRFQHVQYGRPLAYLRDGYYRRITNVLGDKEGGAWWGVDELCEFRVKKALAGNSAAIHFGHGGGHARFVVLDANNVPGRAVGVNAWRYDEAWNNADLELAIAGHRLFKLVHLRAGHPAYFRFRIDEHDGFDPATGLFVGGFRLEQPVLQHPTDPLQNVPLAWTITPQGNKYLLRVDLPPGDYAGWTLDPQLVLQPGEAAGKDTMVYSLAPTFNYGAALSLIQFNLTKGLLEFDLSSIPAAAAVVAATLYLYQSGSGAAGAWMVTVWSIAVGNAAWTEGNQNGALAPAGTPCWDALAANGAGGVTTAWAGSAGLATANIDYETPALGTFAGNKSDANGTEYTLALAPSRVQGWCGASNTNYGLLLTANASIAALASSGHATAAWRPKLVVDYTAAGSSSLRRGGHRLL